MTFLEKIADIRSRVALHFDSKNPHFNNRYLSLSGLLAAVQPLLEEHGLLLTQAGVVQAPNSFMIQTVVQDLAGAPTDEEGNVVGPHFIASCWPIPITDNPQKTAAATTYARRYSLLALIAGAAEDDDGNEAAGLGLESLCKRL